MNKYEQNFQLTTQEAYKLSVNGYLNICFTNLSFWFSFNNFFNILFGNEFGNLRIILQEARGYPSIYNMLLEIFMSFGIFGSVIIFMLVKKY